MNFNITTLSSIARRETYEACAMYFIQYNFDIENISSNQD